MTLLGRWPRPKHSSDRAVIGNALRCCLRILRATAPRIAVPHMLPSSE